MLSITVNNAFVDAGVLRDVRAAVHTLRRGHGPAVRLALAVGRWTGVSGWAALGLERAGRVMGHKVVQAGGVQDGLAALARTALARAFDVAILGLSPTADAPAMPRRGRAAHAVVAVSGAVGGAAGLAGFAPDVAVLTLSIMREVAQIARDNGEDLSTQASRLACLEVFGLDGADAATVLQARLALQGAPLAAVLGRVAGRYATRLGARFVAGAAPVLGAVGGVALNAAILRRYRDLAQAQFTLRRLERMYGAAVIQEAVRRVEAAMDQMPDPMPPPSHDPMRELPPPDLPPPGEEGQVPMTDPPPDEVPGPVRHGPNPAIR